MALLGALGKRSRRGQAPSVAERLFVAANVGGRDTFWEVNAEGAVVVDRIPVDAPHVVYFDDFDNRMMAEKPVSLPEGKRMATRELGEKSWVICKGRAVYARAVDDIVTVKNGITPGALLLDTLVGEPAHGGRDALSGFMVSERGRDEAAFMVLYAYNKDGTISQPQVSITPSTDDLNILAKSFAERHQITSDDEHQLFPHEQMLEAIPGLPQYPREEEFGGLRKSTLAKGGSALFAAGLLASCLFMSYSFWMTTLVAADVLKLQIEVRAAAVETERIARESGRGFARAVSLNPDEMFAQAEALWRRGSTVLVAGDRKELKFTLLIPIEAGRGSGVADSRFVMPRTNEVVLMEVITSPPPQGLTLKSVDISGDFSAYMVKYGVQQAGAAVRSVASR